MNTEKSAQGKALQHGPSCRESFAGSLCCEIPLSCRRRFSGNHLLDSRTQGIACSVSTGSNTCVCSLTYIRIEFVCSTLCVQTSCWRLDWKPVHPKAVISEGPPGYVCAVSVSFKQTNKSSFSCFYCLKSLIFVMTSLFFAKQKNC